MTVDAHTKPQRYDDWPERLNAYLEKVGRRPFKWGTHDCCTFAAGAVKAMTGRNHMAEFRGTYRSEAEAAEALKAIGKGSLYATIRSKFGNPVKPALAKRGDLMMADQKTVNGQGAPVLLICLGEQSAGPGAEGLVFLPTLSCLRGFRV